MRVFKPQSVGLLYRTFERDRRFFFVVTALLPFDFRRSAHLLAEADMWELAASELGAEGVLDEGLAQREGGVLVRGYAFAPGDEPVVASQVRVELGSVDKSL